jgi:hypothetical protein
MKERCVFLVMETEDGNLSVQARVSVSPLRWADIAATVLKVAVANGATWELIAEMFDHVELGEPASVNAPYILQGASG